MDKSIVNAQLSNNAYKNSEFYNFQMQFARVKKAHNSYFENIKKEFNSNKMTFPPKNIFIRILKWNRLLEVWIQLEKADTFMLYKTYRMCAFSGTYGPKLREGDKQIPEGFYFLDEFNPNSEYLLSLLVNYPNFRDLKICDKSKPGGDIYIHGSCATVGCVPINDEGIQEVYLLSMLAKSNGQENIPVHVFPSKFDKDGLSFLGKEYANHPKLLEFWSSIKRGYDYFEKYHKLPWIMYDEQGNYIIE